MPIDVRGIIDTKWNSAPLSGVAGEPQKTRLEALAALEKEMAEMQGHRSERAIKIYTSPGERPPSKDGSLNPDAFKEVYVESSLLGSADPAMEYRLATMLITEQFRPENWKQLSTDAKLETISLLEQAMALQQTQKAVSTPSSAPLSGTPAAPSPRPARTVEGADGAEKPLFSLTDGKVVIGKEKLEQDLEGTAGLDILESMACEQLHTLNWNSSTEEARISTLQLAEFGMAARQSRAPRYLSARKLDLRNAGNYSPSQPHLLNISEDIVKSEVKTDLASIPLDERKISDFSNFTMLDTVIHEGRHATQDDAERGLIASRTLKVTPETIAGWGKSNAAYLRYSHYTYSAYRFQKIEADANDFSHNQVCVELSEKLAIDPLYQEYLKIQNRTTEYQIQAAKLMYGEEYQKAVDKIMEQEQDARTRRSVQASDIAPDADLDVSMERFGNKLLIPSFSPSSLMRKETVKNTEAYRDAVSLLGKSLLTTDEKTQSGKEKEDCVHSKLSQLYFDGDSFESLCEKAGSARWPDGYKTIYAAALLTEALTGRRRLVSEMNSMPGPASLHLGTGFTAMLRPVPSPVVAVRGRSRETEGMRIPGKSPVIVKPIQSKVQVPKKAPAPSLRFSDMRGLSKPITVHSLQPGIASSPTRLDPVNRYNVIARKNATANHYRLIASAMIPSLPECQGKYYGYPGNQKMTQAEFGLAVGVLLNRGYCMSDILDPNKLQAAKTKLGKGLRKLFPETRPITEKLHKRKFQYLEDAKNGYRKFCMKTEAEHLNARVSTAEERAAMLADDRFQPEMLRVMGGFGEAFRGFEAHYNNISSELTPADKKEFDTKLLPVRNLSTILSPDRVKDVFEYYQSSEYLQGKTSLNGIQERKAANATLILQEFMVREQDKQASEQTANIDVFAALPGIKEQRAKLRTMDSSRLSEYIQKNSPITEFLSKARGGSVATPLPVTPVPDPPPVSSALEAGSARPPVEKIALAALTESVRGASKTPVPKAKPPARTSAAEKPEEAARRK